MPEALGAETVSQVYSRVIRILRGQQAAKYFREPVPWQKLQLHNYPEVIKNPMDLLTVLRKLEKREYASVASLRADVDLIWDNAVLFNGEVSWIKKYVDVMRALTARKFAEAASRPLGIQRKPSTGRVTLPSGSRGGVGNVPVGDGAGHFITPQMRLQLLENSIKLSDTQRAAMVRLARQLCSTAVETHADGRESKVDVDALASADPRVFFRLDFHVRQELAAGSEM